MPSNEQRREAAKRKLERQLERRAVAARRRKQLTIGGSIVGVVAVVVVIALIVWLTGGDDEASTQATPVDVTDVYLAGAVAMPQERSEPLPEIVNCEYVPGGEASREVQPPSAEVNTTAGAINLTMETSEGNIGLTLDREKAPCTANSFESLASQGYYDNTPCHRLVLGGSIRVLQCGDPNGIGNGGPGYQFNDEFPVDQFDPMSMEAQSPVIYPRGTIAMANAGPGTNGSQFFMLLRDSALPPAYTVFGTIDDGGLETLETIGRGGNDDPAGNDGAPNLPVEIRSVTAS
ncbi:MAG: peptidylprolyl isomerase [Rhodococcus sp.]|nr:peptidylprolyl isomerase [Rhodococcus sp. (in: high G+C Gram-positive bacteria)]